MAMTPEQRSKRMRLNMLMAYAAASYASTKGTVASLFGAGTTGESLLGSTEVSGLAVDFTGTTSDLLIRDPAGTLNYSGLPFTTESGKFTLARASTATRIASTGLITSVASGAYRIDHALTTGTRKGLLLEESRVNVVLWNSDLTNAAWTKTSVTAATAAVISDGYWYERHMLAVDYVGFKRPLPQRLCSARHRHRQHRYDDGQRIDLDNRHHHRRVDKGNYSDADHHQPGGWFPHCYQRRCSISLWRAKRK